MRIPVMDRLQNGPVISASKCSQLCTTPHLWVWAGPETCFYQWSGAKVKEWIWLHLREYIRTQCPSCKPVSLSSGSEESCPESYSCREQNAVSKSRSRQSHVSLVEPPSETPAWLALWLHLHETLDRGFGWAIAGPQIPRNWQKLLRLC